ncbi:DUF2141 domain-containing protein [Novosphingobium sp. Gsoil 351]|uniref:DUF2141 domain-containing protein n=1 Tax=Novosphingobium sp. Gsoil 351 TaxID=2675225 RepID=UPI0012B4F584|nr:DUF2141 domain-containing protein [Novosphingobium sp. Gsoil 351]QGN56512.1 DUF2141 domain-containing protein [Novosphingobium sp. Gsoil 351]
MACAFLLALPAAAFAGPHQELGKAEGRCRTSETGPALMVSVLGLKDRTGNLKLEVYPANDNDFLQDDRILVAQGKTFRRVELPVASAGTPVLCVRLPAPGRYAVSLLHDRDANHKFNLSGDGIGFAGNPRLAWSKPKAAASSVVAGTGLTQVPIVINYRRGLLSFAPLERRNARR